MTAISLGESFTGSAIEGFYSGHLLSADVPWPFPVGIGGHPYFMDTKQFEYSSVEILRQAFDQSGEPGEQTMAVEGLWKRYQTDWTHGAGQTFFDDEGASRRRFYTSKGADIWTGRELCLLKDTAERRTSANTNLKILSVGGYFYIADGTEVHHTTTPDSPSWTAAAINIAEGAVSVSDITTDGNTVYAAITTNGIHKTTAGASTSTHLSTYAATLVEFANNRLIAAKAGEIADISSAGTATVLLTHFNTSFTFTAVVGTAAGIFAAGNNADKGEFFFIGFNAATGGLTTPAPAGSLPDGEYIYSMEYYGGTLILGTSKGIRLASIENDRGVSPAPLISTSTSVLCLEPQDDYVWFGWTDYDATSTGLGRAQLSTFTETLVPAYATDLMVTAQGSITAVASFAGKRYFAISGDGFYGEHPTQLVASATLNTGWIGFSSVETKVAASVEVRHAPLDGVISASFITEDEDTVDLGESATAESLEPSGTWSGQNTSAELFQIEFTLTRKAGDATAGPCLRRWTFRALIAPHQIDQFIIPILLYELVDSTAGPEYEGANVAFNPLEEWLFLKALESTRSVVTLQLGTQTHTCTVRSVGIPRGSVRGWDNGRDFFNSTVYVRLMTLEAGT